MRYRPRPSITFAFAGTATSPAAPIALIRLPSIRTVRFACTRSVTPSMTDTFLITRKPAAVGCWAGAPPAARKRHDDHTESASNALVRETFRDFECGDFFAANFCI